MANSDVRLDLLFKEIDDLYVQENFRKLKRYLECTVGQTGGSSGGDTNIINNTTNVFEGSGLAFSPYTTFCCGNTGDIGTGACEMAINCGSLLDIGNLYQDLVVGNLGDL